MTYTTMEKEVVGLCICLEALGDIANHALLELRPVSAHPNEAEVYFHTNIHQQIFLIRLLDFVKESGDSKLTGVTGSCLEILRSACSTQSFNYNQSISNLKQSVEDFDFWLNQTLPLKLWLPTLNIDATLNVSRLDFLKISGNHSKHNLSRLTGVSKGISQILTNHGYSVPLEHIPLALYDFREHLEENFFIYYGSWLAELTNNIIWGIQTYLQSTFYNSYQVEQNDSGIYHFSYPNEIQHDIPKQWFWRLMNNIRKRPYLRKFACAHYLKDKSSLEWLE